MRSWQEVMFLKTVLIILNSHVVKYNLQSCSLVKRLHIELSQQNQDIKLCLCLCYSVMNVFYTCNCEPLSTHKQINNKKVALGAN